MLLNERRPRLGNLKERYEELVNTFVNTQAESVNNAGWGRAIIGERSVAVVPRE